MYSTKEILRLSYLITIDKVIEARIIVIR